MGPSGLITQVIGTPERVKVHLKRLMLDDGEAVITASDRVGHVLYPSSRND